MSKGLEPEGGMILNKNNSFQLYTDNDLNPRNVAIIKAEQRKNETNGGAYLLSSFTITVEHSPGDRPTKVRLAREGEFPGAKEGNAIIFEYECAISEALCLRNNQLKLKQTLNDECGECDPRNSAFSTYLLKAATEKKKSYVVYWLPEGYTCNNESFNPNVDSQDKYSLDVVEVPLAVDVLIGEGNNIMMVPQLVTLAAIEVAIDGTGAKFDEFSKPENSAAKRRAASLGQSEF